MRPSNLSQVSVLCSLNKTAVRKQNNCGNAGGKKRRGKKNENLLLTSCAENSVVSSIRTSGLFFFFNVSSQGRQTQRDHDKDGTPVCVNTDFQDL